MNLLLWTYKQGVKIMPRKPRNYLPEVPCHVIQRGNNRQACFYTDDDCRFYLDCLKKASDRYQCDIHAYVLMTNHVHLLITPKTEESISRMMQSIGRRYVQYINTTYNRTGTLWEGRHKASLVDTAQYLLTCYHYIEMNPVRAGIVNQPEDYRRSSARAHIKGEPDLVIQDHPVYLALGQTESQRSKTYQSLFNGEIESDGLKQIRHAINHDMPLGNDRFKEEIEMMLGRRINDRRRGRPKKEKTNEFIAEVN